MTFVEFFDENASENICASLSTVPDRMILLGDNRKKMAKHSQHYQQVFEGRGTPVEILWRTVNKNNLENITQVLCSIMDTYNDCIFDVTGGEDLFLVALGQIIQKYQNRTVQVQRFNLRNSTVQDCDGDGKTTALCPPAITVQEHVCIFGGRIVPDTTYVWDMDEEFLRDIHDMWQICRPNPGAWNWQMGILNKAEGQRSEESAALSTFAPTQALLRETHKQDFRQLFSGTIVEQLAQLGLIEDYFCDDEEFRITYKNRQIKQVLTKAGQILELKIFQAVKHAAEADGSPVYNDALVGVNIDWDDKPPKEGEMVDVLNEVDVVAMHGMIPVFISCKNGFVSVEELYKLNTVAQRFGGDYSKMVLIISELDEDFPSTAHLLDRAEEMKIRIVKDVHNMPDEELDRVVRSFWCN